MISSHEIEEFLPIPIKIEINDDQNEFELAVGNSFQKLLDKHNKGYETEIDNISIFFCDNDEGTLEHNECQIFIGKEVVHSMKGTESFDEDSQLAVEYYKSIVNITDDILSAWHDKIIEIQNENELKIEQYKAEEYDELLYGYYLMQHDSKAFKYLKKLAARYPNSTYMNKLRRVYRYGLYGWHRRSYALNRKLRKEGGSNKHF